MWNQVGRGALAVVVVAMVASCGVSGGAEDGPESSQPPQNALSNVDPCSLIPPQKLASLGYPDAGEPVNNIASEPGCDYLGESMLLTVYRNAEQTVSSYESAREWAEYSRIEVGGREAVRALSAEDVAVGGVCTTVVSAGGGVVILDGVSNDPRVPFDACGELERVAQAIESDLPK